MQKLLASAGALISDGSIASMAYPVHEAEEDQSATIRNVFGTEDYFALAFPHRAATLKALADYRCLLPSLNYNSFRASQSLNLETSLHDANRREAKWRGES